MNARYLSADAFETFSNRLNPAGPATTRSFGDHRACCREILRLTGENARLADELARARVTNEDLLRSTEIWIRLYEAQLGRARRPQTQASPASTEMLRA
jgi:hypothetical protein